MQHYLIMYDVADKKRLHKVALWLENYAWRIQKSVFVTKADDELLDKIISGIKRRIEEKEDCVCVFAICEKDWKKRKFFGAEEENTVQRENEAIVL